MRAPDVRSGADLVDLLVEGPLGVVGETLERQPEGDAEEGDNEHGDGHRNDTFTALVGPPCRQRSEHRSLQMESLHPQVLARRGEVLYVALLSPLVIVCITEVTYSENEMSNQVPKSRRASKNGTAIKITPGTRVATVTGIHTC